MKLYLYEKCETCRKAARWLDEKMFPYTSIPIRETPPNIKELFAMLAKHDGNMKKLYNTSGKDYRDPVIKEKLASFSNDKIIELLSKQGNLIKRPFLVGDTILLQGFKPDLWESAFSK